jgi:NADH-quinone oxidoreductase subunit M
MTLPLLSVLVWLPILGGIVVLLLGSDERTTLGKQVALGTSILTFIVSIPLFTRFDITTGSMQFVESVAWIPRFNAMYALGVDGISMPLVLLTTFLTPIVIIAGWQVIKTRPAQYFAAFLILEGLMIGVFAALDALLFYVFWEAMLVPMFIIIGIWGGERRVYATVKFFLYTFLGSVFMLVALIYMYLKTGEYSIASFHELPLTMNEQVLIFFAFLLAFAVKVPMFPVHTWLPDAHVEAPTGGSVILAAILLKMGGYGFIRFSLPIAPDASQSLSWLMIALSLIAVVYIGLVALVQRDMKKLIAYSSIAHMGFVTLGFFVVFNALSAAPGTDGARLALQGGMMQMISHGLISGAMFLCVGVLYDRLHSREISAYGGVVNTMPKFAALMVLFGLANAGLPGTSGFVGEFFVILGTFHASAWLAFFAATTLILAWRASRT